jgi:hypothetical protein
MLGPVTSDLSPRGLGSALQNLGELAAVGKRCGVEGVHRQQPGPGWCRRTARSDA